MFNGSLSSQFQFGDMPTGLTPMPLIEEDDDFLAMLQATAKPPVIPSLATANPADLSSNASLRNINLSPPSTESSPSPPNHDSSSVSNIYNIYNNQDMASRATRSANRDAFTGEPSSKRKQLEDLDDDSDEDAPQRKQQHIDGSSSKKSSSKRKSNGGQDDTRLQKRKEQNRAAQRAFRERKERHVKDLEDKVSILEEKTDTQAAENENLRELLTRLQQENLQLKQNQFSFTFQQPLASTSTSPYQTKSSTDANMTAVRPTSNTPSSNTQSPPTEAPLTRMMSNGSSGNLGVTNANRPNTSTPQLTSNSASPSELNLLETFGLGPSPDPNFTQPSALAGLTPSPSGTSYTTMDNAFFGNTPPAGSGGGLNDLGFSSSFGDFPSSFAPMPYQTVTANNLFTSFRDPSENPNAWASFGPNPMQSQSLKSTYDELFGAGTSLSGNEDINMTSLAGLGVSDELMPFAFLPDLSNGTGGSQFGGLSPISHVPTPPSATSTAGPRTAYSGTPTSQPSPQKDHDMVNVQSSTPSRLGQDNVLMDHDSNRTCPKSKQDFEEIIQKTGTSTFGPSANPGVAAGSSDPEVCAKMSLADATKLNLDIGTAWRAVRQHPQFEECDIDELCAELAQKATCDGTNKVIEAQKIMDIVHSIPERAKQRKMSLAARTSA